MLPRPRRTLAENGRESEEEEGPAGVDDGLLVLDDSVDVLCVRIARRGASVRCS